MSTYRILKAPDGEGGIAPPEEVVTISRAELEGLRAKAGLVPSGPESERGPEEAAAVLEAREAAHARELAERDRKAAEWERAFRGALRDREVATALVGRPLIPGAAAQLMKLWREEFDVHEDGGEFKVVDRQGRPAAKAVDAWLSGPDYAHFCRPSSQGGTAARGGGRPATPPPAPAPKTLGEAALVRWQEAAARVAGPSAPVGLGRRR